MCDLVIREMEVTDHSVLAWWVERGGRWTRVGAGAHQSLLPLFFWKSAPSWALNLSSFNSLPICEQRVLPVFFWGGHRLTMIPLPWGQVCVVLSLLLLPPCPGGLWCWSCHPAPGLQETGSMLRPWLRGFSGPGAWVLLRSTPPATRPQAQWWSLALHPTLPPMNGKTNKTSLLHSFLQF